jgi:LPS export ABC transporter permease LptG
MAAQGAHLDLLLPILVQLLPYYVGLALPVAFMIALTVTLSNRDEALELEAILASGLSLGRIALPLTAAAVLVAAATLVANGFLEPRGRYGLRMLQARALEEARVSDLKPLAFYGPADDVTLSFEGTARDRAERLFLHRALPGGREQILTARTAELVRSPGAALLQIRLDDGIAYEDSDPLRRRRPIALSFRSYQLAEPMGALGSVRPRGGDQKELSLTELWEESRTHERNLPEGAVGAEFHSRLARSLAILFLPLLAVPLCLSAKKSRRGLGIACAGILLILFHHAVNFIKDRTLDGEPPPAAAFLALEAAFVALAAWLFVASRHLPSHGPLTPLLRLFRPPDGAGRPAARESRRRATRTLGGYAAGRLALWIAACTAGLALIFQLVDVIDRGEEFVERGFGAGGIARYAMLRLPLIVHQILPLATLAGAILALLRLSRFSEMVAIRGAGISLGRLFVMLVPVAACVTAASFALGEWVAPRTEARLAAWWHSTDPEARGERRWFRVGGDIVSARGVAAAGRELEGLTLYRRDGAGRLTARLSAGTAWAVDGGWRLREVAIVTLTANGPRGASRREMLWPARFGPAEASLIFSPTLRPSTAEARRALAGEAPVSEGPARFEARLRRALAEPLAPLVMLILALPLALASARTGPSWPLLLYPIAAGAAFLVCDGLLAVAAAIGMIPAWVGAWGAALVFGLLGTTVAIYADG